MNRPSAQRDRVDAQQPTIRFWLAVILGSGILIRLIPALSRSLAPDEYLHVFAASGWLDAGRPVLPSGEVYDRAWVYTLMVRESFRMFGVSEWAARLPSLLAGVLTILLTFRIGRRWFSPASALVAAALVAWSPFALVPTSYCRMYSWVQLLFLAAAYAGWRALESPRRAWAWGAAACATVAVLYHLQPIAATAIPAVVVYAVGITAAAVAQGRVQALWRSRDGLVCLAAAVAGIGLVTIGRSQLAWVWHEARFLPPWAVEGMADDLGFYKDLWQRTYPVLWRLWPAAVVWLLLQRGRLGWWLACWFAVPLLIHSVLFAAKQERFIYHLLPIFALTVSPLAVELVTRIGRWFMGVVQEAASALRAPAWRRAAVAAGSLALLPALYLFASPWASQTVRMAAGRLRLPVEYLDVPWRAALTTLTAQMAPGDILITTEPLAAAHYRAQPADYVINNHLLPTDGVTASDQSPAAWPHDWYSGQPLVSRVEELDQVMKRSPRGWVVADRARFFSPLVVPVELREAIIARTGEVPLPGITDMVCRRWVSE